MGAWKLPTFSAREWRSATLEALGANGSCTLTTSSASTLSASSIVRATSTGSEAARRRVGENGSTSPTPRTTGSPAASSSSSSGRLRIARRLSRTSESDWEGATISTRCPRSASCAETRATYWLTSLSTSQANGVTWAMARPSVERGTSEHVIGGPAAGCAKVGAMPGDAPILSAAVARRIALAAQGFGRRRPGGRIRAERQADSRARRTGWECCSWTRSTCSPGRTTCRCSPAWGRTTATVLDRLAAHTGGRVNRRFVEYWAHEASLIPIESHPLFRWRMESAIEDAWGRMARMAKEQPEVIEETLQLVADQGPIRASATGIPRPDPQPGQMWNWHEGKVALEYLFWAGRITAARRVNFERWYDIPERVLPPDVLAAPIPSREDAQRQLTRIAAAALGVATEPDLGDYFRLPRADSKARVAELVDSGELTPVQVRGWGAPATCGRPRGGRAGSRPGHCCRPSIR